MRFSLLQELIDIIRGRRKFIYPMIINRGKNNKFNINKKAKAKVQVVGNNNNIVIKTSENFKASILIGRTDCPCDNCTIYIDEKVTSNGLNIIMLEDNQELKIGPDSMFAENVEIWLSDTHTVINMQDEIINRGKFVNIGEHCWIGKSAKILKNTNIPDNTIVGLGAIVSKSIENENCVIAGNPARIVKTNVNWNRNRIKNYQKSKIYN